MGTFTNATFISSWFEFPDLEGVRRKRDDGDLEKVVPIPMSFPPVLELVRGVGCDEPLCNNNTNNACEAAQPIHNKY